VLEDNAQRHAGLLAQRNHGSGFGTGAGDGLFKQDRLASLGQGLDQIEAGIGRCNDDGKVDGRIGGDAPARLELGLALAARVEQREDDIGVSDISGEQHVSVFPLLFHVTCANDTFRAIRQAQA